FSNPPPRRTWWGMDAPFTGAFLEPPVLLVVAEWSSLPGSWPAGGRGFCRAPDGGLEPFPGERP
ncbi:MAG: hypothetical protein R6U98_26465, partial [Pirellulaceae bacterium]